MLSRTCWKLAMPSRPRGTSARTVGASVSASASACAAAAHGVCGDCDGGGLEWGWCAWPRAGPRTVPPTVGFDGVHPARAGCCCRAGERAEYGEADASRAADLGDLGVGDAPLPQPAVLLPLPPTLADATNAPKSVRQLISYILVYFFFYKLILFFVFF